jgi:FKBP-type peptidyl-prolyl cis-trans isomerase
MKKIFSVCCLLLCVVALYARGIREELRLADEKTRVSYALGLVMGGDLEFTGLDLDYAAYAEGLRDAIEKQEARIDRDEAMEIVRLALEEALDRQAEENRQKEALFLSENGKRPEVRTTPSGLQYEVITESGVEKKPGRTDAVRVHYEGSLVDGTVFDSSDDEEEGVELPLSGVIPGWSEGLLLMSEGSTYKLYIPSELAYGEAGAGQVIPPYSTLVFVVELLEIIKRPVSGADEPDDMGEGEIE